MWATWQKSENFVNQWFSSIFIKIIFCIFNVYESICRNKPIKDQQNEADVTDIVALSSHKTHSTPVDPIELKKRLVDLLIQRTTKGDQQALKLKVNDHIYPLINAPK